ncbi:hypothetical protein V8D89_008477 [Ganoderma adspersum]
MDLYLTLFFLVGLWSVLRLFWTFVQRQLPSNKAHTLTATLHDAEDVFRFSVEGGLLDEATTSDLHFRLLALHERADTLRLRAFQATTLWEDLMNMRRGLSHEMTRLAKDVRAVRARISAVSYVELQNVRLCTIDGKEVAQLRREITHAALSASVPIVHSALFAVADPVDFGRAGSTDEKVVVLAA